MKNEIRFLDSNKLLLQRQIIFSLNNLFVYETEKQSCCLYSHNFDLLSKGWFFTVVGHHLHITAVRKMYKVLYILHLLSLFIREKRELLLTRLTFQNSSWNVAGRIRSEQKAIMRKKNCHQRYRGKRPRLL